MATFLKLYFETNDSPSSCLEMAGITGFEQETSHKHERK